MQISSNIHDKFPTCLWDKCPNILVEYRKQKQPNHWNWFTLTSQVLLPLLPKMDFGTPSLADNFSRMIYVIFLTKQK